MSKNGYIVLESFIGSLGILVFGFLSIPLAAKWMGASITLDQGIGMSFIFFVSRFLWLLCLRSFFAHKNYRVVAVLFVASVTLILLFNMRLFDFVVATP